MVTRWNPWDCPGMKVKKKQNFLHIRRRITGSGNFPPHVQEEMPQLPNLKRYSLISEIPIRPEPAFRFLALPPQVPDSIRCQRAPDLLKTTQLALNHGPLWSAADVVPWSANPTNIFRTTDSLSDLSTQFNRYTGNTMGLKYDLWNILFGAIAYPNICK